MSATVQNRISTVSADPVGIARVSIAVTERCSILCWHMNDYESIAMWDLYTNGVDGVAISTTVAKLKRAVEGIPEDCFIGTVEYTDHPTADTNSTMPFGLLQPLFQKGMSYTHECEVRAIISPIAVRLKVEQNQLVALIR